MTLTRSALDRMTADLHEHARANLARDGHLAAVLLGLNAQGGQVLMAAADARGSDPEDIASAEAAGIFLAPGSLALAGDELEALFNERGVVAVISFGEFWALDGPEAAQTRPGESIAAHPGRDESIYTASAWPRGRAERLIASRIVRDPAGRPGTPARPVDLTGQASVAHLLWFTERLPR